MRKRPPAIKMMSRHDKDSPAILSAGVVISMIQLSDASSSTRNRKASDRPTARACRALRGASGPVRMAMNTMLSMPRTISSAVSVNSAAHAFGSPIRSIMSNSARQQAGCEEIHGDQDQAPRDIRARVEAVDDRHQRQRCPDCQDSNIERAPTFDPQRVHELERREGQ